MENKRKSFSRIYDKYIDKIYRFVFLKVDSQETAEDLTAEAFSKTWVFFKEKDEEIDNIQAFLYKTARNLVIDYYRQRGRIPVISVDNPAIIDPRQDLEEKAIINSDIKSIKQALANLNEDYQNAIIWYYLDDLSVSEVSQLLDRTKDATRVLIHRALNALKKEIKED